MKLTKQEVFDKVCNHLITQNERSMDNGLCAYRGDDGTMCAAGVLIDDKHYDFSLEGKVCSSGNPCVQNMVLKSGVRMKDLPLVRDLQRVHDNSSVPMWSLELQEIAERYGLTKPECIQ